MTRHHIHDMLTKGGRAVLGDMLTPFFLVAHFVAFKQSHPTFHRKSDVGHVSVYQINFRSTESLANSHVHT